MSKDTSTQTTHATYTVGKAPPAQSSPLRDEIYVMRKAVKEMSRDFFDLSELIGHLSAEIQIWVGVAEE